MSEGPIQQDRAAHRSPRVTTPAKGRICAPELGTGRSVCGRRGQRTGTWSEVTCSECHAAARAGS